MTDLHPDLDGELSGERHQLSLQSLVQADDGEPENHAAAEMMETWLLAELQAAVDQYVEVVEAAEPDAEVTIGAPVRAELEPLTGTMIPGLVLVRYTVTLTVWDMSPTMEVDMDDEPDEAFEPIDYEKRQRDAAAELDDELIEALADESDEVAVREKAVRQLMRASALTRSEANGVIDRLGSES